MYKEIVERLTDVHRSLDYELSPVSPHRWDWKIADLYVHRDVLLKELKRYRR